MLPKVHYPPPHECVVCHFKKTNTDHIKISINRFPRELNKYGIDFPYLFNEIIKNIFSDFIPHETITFDDRDLPELNSQVKHLINEKMLYTKIILKMTKKNNRLQCFSPFRVNQVH